MNNLSIAIDGPAGAGKSTIARQIAEILNLIYIDTGAMYRAFTLKILTDNISLRDSNLIRKTLENTKIDIINTSVYLDKVKVDKEIRSPKINSMVSEVATLPFVRQVLVKMQQAIAKDNNVIMDGRDIGTRVLPNANFKFFITASIEERAKRRYKELIEKGYNCTIDDIISELSQRDRIDSQRSMDPLKKADDATVIDTTDKTIDDVINYILHIINKG